MAPDSKHAKLMISYSKSGVTFLSVPHSNRNENDYIVACQRGGVSNKPPWAPGSDKTQGQGSLAITTYNKFKKETDRTFDPFLLRQGEPGTSQYIPTHFNKIILNLNLISFIHSCH